MTWTLQVLREAMVRWPELRALRAELFVNVGDSLLSTIDSMSRDMGAIPVFSFRSSIACLDVPVPDPVEFGSNGNYVMEADDGPPLMQREPRLVFRGSSSSLNEYHHDSWLIVPRLRFAALSRCFPHLIDAGVASRMKLGNNVSEAELEASIGAPRVETLDLAAKSHYRFVLDVDGGLGSSRKRGILASGYVTFFQHSPWSMWYEPLLAENVHYIGIDTYLHRLVDKITYAIPANVPKLCGIPGALPIKWHRTTLPLFTGRCFSKDMRNCSVIPLVTTLTYLQIFARFALPLPKVRWVARLDGCFTVVLFHSAVSM